MTPDDHTWALAYLNAQRDEITFDAGGWPRCSAEALTGLVNLGARLRSATADGTNPYELALNRLTHCTDWMLAMLIAPIDDDADRQALTDWHQARAELHQLGGPA